jgi:hypothetical protein
MSLENSRLYYGKTLQGSAELLTDACRTSEPPPPDFRAALANVHTDVSARYYGCGLVAPQAIRGANILDLGCGSGRDAYVLSQRRLAAVRYRRRGNGRQLLLMVALLSWVA